MHMSNQNIDILCHHGIKGQKWGVRRYQNPDGSLTAAGMKRYGIKSIKYIDNINRPGKKRRSSDEAQIVREIQEYDDRQRRYILKGRNFISRFKYWDHKIKRSDTLESYSCLPIKKKQTNADDDLKKVNPMYKSTQVSSSNNCALCTVAFDMRRRGYDVIARQHAPIDLLYDISEKDVAFMYQDAKIDRYSDIKQAEKALKKQNNSRGACFVSWGKEGENCGGHVVAYQVEKGVPIIYDAQNGEKEPMSTYFNDDTHNVRLMRLDNRKIDTVACWLAVE